MRYCYRIVIADKRFKHEGKWIATFRYKKDAVKFANKKKHARVIPDEVI